MKVRRRPIAGWSRCLVSAVVPMAPRLLLSAAMKQIAGYLALATIVGCTSSASDPVVGTGSVARNGTSLGVRAVRAVADYAFFGSGNDSYGGYAIMFSTEGAGLRCGEVAGLTSIEQLDISTPQVFTPSSSGRASLSLGDIPFVVRDPFDDNPPALTIAELSTSQPAVTDGKVTITAFDADSISGTFTATGPDSSTTPTSVTTFSGSFDATICPH